MVISPLSGILNDAVGFLSATLLISLITCLIAFGLLTFTININPVLLTVVFAFGHITFWVI